MMRSGYTTGTCAAAAAKVAALAMFTGVEPETVDVALVGGERVVLPVAEVGSASLSAWAAVRKDAGDDPDVTHRMLVCAELRVVAGEEVELRGGEGVGTVTLPGLSVPPGRPAINPGPCEQIVRAIREVTKAGIEVSFSIPGGAAIAAETLNPRVGVLGGLSILGSDGLVRPFSHERALVALRLAVDVATANGVSAPVLVPGRIGRRHALAALGCSELMVIEAGNEFGAMLERCGALGMARVLLFGHPGKLAKLGNGDFDTHSSRSKPALSWVREVARPLGWVFGPEIVTVEAAFLALDGESRGRLGREIALRIRSEVKERYPSLDPAVWLITLAGETLGLSGEARSWKG